MDQRERMNDYEVSIKAAVQGFLSNFWVALPGDVDSFNADNTVNVRCNVKFQQTKSDGTTQWINMQGLIINCPIVWQGGGGFVMTFKPQKGDEALVVFASRCIDNWFEKGGQQLQAQLRVSSLSDGFAFVGPRSKPNQISGVSANAQLRMVDGSSYIELTSDGKVNIKAPGGVHIISGKLDVDQEVTAQAAGATPIPLSSHLHGGVQTGGSNTGVPIP